VRTSGEMMAGHAGNTAKTGKSDGTAL